MITIKNILYTIFGSFFEQEYITNFFSYSSFIHGKNSHRQIVIIVSLNKKNDIMECVVLSEISVNTWACVDQSGTWFISLHWREYFRLVYRW